MALRPWINRWAAGPRVSMVLTALAPRMMTLYLWHMTALVTVAGVALLGFGLETPAAGSAVWWVAVPVWLAALGAVMVVLVAVVGRFEQPPATLRPAGPVLATVLVGGGLAVLMVTGFAPGLAPGLAVAALLAGLSTNRAGAPLPR
jgi:hypothetical protein